MEDCLYTNRCWSLDDAMIDSLDPDYIRGYFSFNLIGEPGGNCFNLVRGLILNVLETIFYIRNDLT